MAYSDRTKHKRWLSSGGHWRQEMKFWESRGLAYTFGTFLYTQRLVCPFRVRWGCTGENQDLRLPSWRGVLGGVKLRLARGWRRKRICHPPTPNPLPPIPCPLCIELFVVSFFYFYYFLIPFLYDAPNSFKLHVFLLKQGLDYLFRAETTSSDFAPFPSFASVSTAS